MRAVFLDRDGVLVGSQVVDGVPTPSPEPELLPGVVEACDLLREAGFRLVMVTNQPDIARGRVDRAQVDRTNEVLQSRLGLADVRVCPHDDDDACRCRKPASGMLTDAALDGGIDLAGSVMVGDRWRDVEAGKRAGTRTVFVDHRYDERQPESPDLVVGSLLDAVPYILGLDTKEHPDADR